MTSVLIVGSGAREHAMAWKLRQSASISDLYVAPGNPGTASIARNVSVSATDVPALVRLVEECDIDLTVVGPEAPLALGLADALRVNGRRVVGPDAAAARIESSKSFAKELMRRAGVPTGGYTVYDEMDEALRQVESAAYPLVIKADGLTSGKGVTICRDAAEAHATILEMMAGGRFQEAGRRIVIEEFLEGPEVSLIALVDGERAVPLPAAQDHKRLGDGDTGPNTGGMGAYAPVPFVATDELEVLTRLTVQPVVDALAELGTPYRGFLFAGLILTASGPRVLEYNCRFGDPEAQVILPLLQGDLLPWLEAMAVSRLEGSVPVSDGAAVGVVLASEGYPESPKVGQPIDGLDDAPAGVLAFQAGTACDQRGRIVTAGGRVVTVVGIGADVDEAAERAYRTPIEFAGMQRRNDIAWQARSGSGSLGGGASPPLASPPQSGREGCTGRDVVVGAGPRACPPVASHTLYRGKSLCLPGKTSAFPMGSAPPARERSARRRRFRVAVLASGEGSNLQALIDACRSGDLEAEIVLVVSHNESAGALGRAMDAGIPGVTVPLASRRNPVARRAHEAVLLQVLEAVDPDLIVLAGWMLVLSPEFLQRCSCPLLNVHPALLPMEGSPLDVPVLRGAHAVHDALELELPYTGVSVHTVTAEVDAGPVMRREMVRILPDDDEYSLYRRIKAVEHRLLVETVAVVLMSTHYGGVHA